MDHATLIVLLALLQYVWFTARVGLARGKYHVDAPACDGDEAWNRLFRVQQNTMEQLLVFIPALWIFGIFVDSLWGAGFGLVFIAGRFIYRAAYLKDPGARGRGFAITFLPTAVMLAWSLLGGRLARA